MHILISNDDGVHSPGISLLHRELSGFAQCSVVAPLQDMSGVSCSITLNRPLYPRYLHNGYIGVDGTPTDCVHLGMNGLLADEPDMVVSGINLGANLGDDILYSGTVAAAMEGRFARHPSFAFSVISPEAKNLESAACIAGRIVKEYSQLKVAPFTIINVNIPDLPMSQIKGIRITRLGHRSRPNPMVPVRNPSGKQGYWISVAGDVTDDSPDTDFYAVTRGFVSVTPLLFDRSYHDACEGMRTLEDLL